MTAITPTALDFRTVIGLEVHAQVLTRSKMYCGCSSEYASAPPNTHVCQVCLGAPGALPVINRAAIEAVIRTGLALGSSIARFSKLDRKNYVYPDLPKGYQISQYDMPLCDGGSISFESAGVPVKAGITRVHIEEDTGRLLHRTASNGVEISLVDLNRSGVPLMEIVGDPDLSTPREAHDYLVSLRQTLRYLGASTGNMEDGAFRCDANISTRTVDGAIVGEKVEIKNMNSFKAVERALSSEETRQREILTSGGTIEQETRGWIEDQGITVSQRTKEYAHDYRYFPEPDLPPLAISEKMEEELRTSLPELPAARRQRFVRDFGLGEPEAALLTSERATADFFETVVDRAVRGERPRIAANWLLNDVFALQRERNLDAETFPIEASQLKRLLDMLADDELTSRAAKEVLAGLQGAEDPKCAAERMNLLSLDDDAIVRDAALRAMEAFPQAVTDYKDGKKAAIGRLLGETIKGTGGRANPDSVRAMLIELLDSDPVE